MESEMDGTICVTSSTPMTSAVYRKRNLLSA